MLKRERKETDDKCPWLDKEDERRNLMDRQILERYVGISCLSGTEKKELLDMLYNYKNTLDLREK